MAHGGFSQSGSGSAGGGGAASSVSVTNFPATQTVTGSVGINGVTFPETINTSFAGIAQPVTATINNPVWITGSVGVALPSTTQNVSFAAVSQPVSMSNQPTVLLPSVDTTNNVEAVAWKPLAVNTYAPSMTGSFAFLVSGSVKGSAGNLYSVQATNRNAALRYLQIFNAIVGPAAGAVPLVQVIVPPAGGSAGAILLGTDFFTVSGLFFSTGITWGVSTTGGTFTAATAADCDVMVLYK